MRTSLPDTHGLAINRSFQIPENNPNLSVKAVSPPRPILQRGPHPAFPWEGTSCTLGPRFRPRWQRAEASSDKTQGRDLLSATTSSSASSAPSSNSPTSTWTGLVPTGTWGGGRRMSQTALPPSQTWKKGAKAGGGLPGASGTHKGMGRDKLEKGTGPR